MDLNCHYVVKSFNSKDDSILSTSITHNRITNVGKRLLLSEFNRPATGIKSGNFRYEIGNAIALGNGTSLTTLDMTDLENRTYLNTFYKGNVQNPLCPPAGTYTELGIGYIDNTIPGAPFQLISRTLMAQPLVVTDDMYVTCEYNIRATAPNYVSTYRDIILGKTVNVTLTANNYNTPTDNTFGKGLSGAMAYAKLGKAWLMCTKVEWSDVIVNAFAANYRFHFKNTTGVTLPLRGLDIVFPHSTIEHQFYAEDYPTLLPDETFHFDFNMQINEGELLKQQGNPTGALIPLVDAYATAVTYSSPNYRQVWVANLVGTVTGNTYTVFVNDIQVGQNTKLSAYSGLTVELDRDLVPFAVDHFFKVVQTNPQGEELTQFISSAYTARPGSDGYMKSPNVSYYGIRKDRIFTDTPPPSAVKIRYYDRGVQVAEVPVTAGVLTTFTIPVEVNLRPANLDICCAYINSQDQRGYLSPAIYFADKETEAYGTYYDPIGKRFKVDGNVYGVISGFTGYSYPDKYGYFDGLNDKEPESELGWAHYNIASTVGLNADGTYFAIPVGGTSGNRPPFPTIPRLLNSELEAKVLLSPLKFGLDKPTKTINFKAPNLAERFIFKRSDGVILVDMVVTPGDSYTFVSPVDLFDKYNYTAYNVNDTFGLVSTEIVIKGYVIDVPDMPSNVIVNAAEGRLTAHAGYNTYTVKLVRYGLSLIERTVSPNTDFTIVLPDTLDPNGNYKLIAYDNIGRTSEPYYLFGDVVDVPATPYDDGLPYTGWTVGLGGSTTAPDIVPNIRDYPASFYKVTVDGQPAEYTCVMGDDNVYTHYVTMTGATPWMMYAREGSSWNYAYGGRNNFAPIVFWSGYTLYEGRAPLFVSIYNYNQGVQDDINRSVHPIITDGYVKYTVRFTFSLYDESVDPYCHNFANAYDTTPYQTLSSLGIYIDIVNFPTSMYDISINDLPATLTGDGDILYLTTADRSYIYNTNTGATWKPTDYEERVGDVAYADQVDHFRFCINAVYNPRSVNKPFKTSKNGSSIADVYNLPYAKFTSTSATGYTQCVSIDAYVKAYVPARVIGYADLKQNMNGSINDATNSNTGFFISNDGKDIRAWINGVEAEIVSHTSTAPDSDSIDEAYLLITAGGVTFKSDRIKQYTSIVNNTSGNNVHELLVLSNKALGLYDRTYPLSYYNWGTIPYSNYGIKFAQLSLDLGSTWFRYIGFQVDLTKPKLFNYDLPVFTTVLDVSDPAVIEASVPTIKIACSTDLFTPDVIDGTTNLFTFELNGEVGTAVITPVEVPTDEMLELSYYDYRPCSYTISFSNCVFIWDELFKLNYVSGDAGVYSLCIKPTKLLPFSNYSDFFWFTKEPYNPPDYTLGLVEEYYSYNDGNDGASAIYIAFDTRNLDLTAGEVVIVNYNFTEITSPDTGTFSYRRPIFNVMPGFDGGEGPEEAPTSESMTASLNNSYLFFINNKPATAIINVDFSNPQAPMFTFTISTEDVVFTFNTATGSFDLTEDIALAETYYILMNAITAKDTRTSMAQFFISTGGDPSINTHIHTSRVGFYFYQSVLIVYGEDNGYPEKVYPPDPTILRYDPTVSTYEDVVSKFQFTTYDHIVPDVFNEGAKGWEVTVNGKPAVLKSTFNPNIPSVTASGAYFTKSDNSYWYMDFMPNDKESILDLSTLEQVIYIEHDDGVLYFDARNMAWNTYTGKGGMYKLTFGSLYTRSLEYLTEYYQDGPTRSFFFNNLFEWNLGRVAVSRDYYRESGFVTHRLVDGNVHAYAEQYILTRTFNPDGDVDNLPLLSPAYIQNSPFTNPTKVDLSRAYGGIDISNVPFSDLVFTINGIEATCDDSGYCNTFGDGYVGEVDFGPRVVDPEADPAVPLLPTADNSPSFIRVSAGDVHLVYDYISLLWYIESAPVGQYKLEVTFAQEGWDIPVPFHDTPEPNGRGKSNFLNGFLSDAQSNTGSITVLNIYLDHSTVNLPPLTVPVPSNLQQRLDNQETNMVEDSIIVPNLAKYPFTDFTFKLNGVVSSAVLTTDPGEDVYSDGETFLVITQPDSTNVLYYKFEDNEGTLEFIDSFLLGGLGPQPGPMLNPPTESLVLLDEAADPYTGIVIKPFIFTVEITYNNILPKNMDLDVITMYGYNCNEDYGNSLVQVDVAGNTKSISAACIYGFNAVNRLAYSYLSPELVGGSDVGEGGGEV